MSTTLTSVSSSSKEVPKNQRRAARLRIARGDGPVAEDGQAKSSSVATKRNGRRAEVDLIKPWREVTGFGDPSFRPTLRHVAAEYLASSEAYRGAVAARQSFDEHHDGLDPDRHDWPHYAEEVEFRIEDERLASTVVIARWTSSLLDAALSRLLGMIPVPDPNPATYEGIDFLHAAVDVGGLIILWGDLAEEGHRLKVLVKSSIVAV